SIFIPDTCHSVASLDSTRWIISWSLTWLLRKVSTIYASFNDMLFLPILLIFSYYYFIESSAPFYEHQHLKDKNKQLFVSQNNDYLKLDYGICNIPVRMGILYERRIQMVDSQEMVIHLVTRFFPASFPIRDLGSGWQIEA